MFMDISLWRSIHSRAFDLFEKIRNHGKTVVIVTHDFELGKRCDYIIDLPKSRSDVYDL